MQDACAQCAINHIKFNSETEQWVLNTFFLRGFLSNYVGVSFKSASIQLNFYFLNRVTAIRSAQPKS